MQRDCIYQVGHYIDTPSIARWFSGLGHSDDSAAVALCRSWPFLLIDLIFLVNSFLFVLLVGNPLKAGFISEPCYNLIYLELAACRVTALPSDMARLTPNLRVLNLNYNFLEDVRPLQGLTRLRKLTIIGSRVKSMRDFVKILRGMLDVEMLDFRYVLASFSAFVVIVLCTYLQLLPDICGADDGSRGAPSTQGLSLCARGVLSTLSLEPLRYCPAPGVYTGPGRLDGSGGV